MSRSAIAPLRWAGDGQYSVDVVGESFAREALADIAMNPTSRRALVFCVASLIPQPSNPYDRNAIAVSISGRAIGHLSREFSKSYCERLSELGKENETFVAYAVISGGLVTQEKQYDYSVQLDIASGMNIDPSSDDVSRSIYQAMEEPVLLQASPSTWTAKVWLPVPRSELCRDLSVDTWTTDKWDEVNFYALNRQRIGLGYKLLGVPKTQYVEHFANHELEMSLELLEKRFAKLIVRTSTP